MVDKQLLFVTTLISTHYSGKVFCGSGFFFQKDFPEEEEDLLNNYWLVTNRHVLYARLESQQKKYLVDKLTFRVRAEKIATSKLTWIEVTLTKEELRQNAKVLPDIGIDIAVIDIREKVKEAIDKEKGIRVTLSPIKDSTLADKSSFPVEVCDDVMVIGYPGGYYDLTNLYPIVKNGTIASMWGADFRGSKCFAIDAKLFPGSSGSLVITKPRMEDLKDGKYLTWNTAKVFYCLGVYSGRPLFNGETFDLGLVWYYSLIPETIDKGIAPVDEYCY